ncbi:hypothetical protein Q5P01_016709 [Channa striata]|uniref:Tripartite motif-containing protein 16-like n=1 Tax=Channa striata TaxID=64152 RepID=A0AA88SBY9_CHASR|nr:hypothetical protein Q5P01_016709 [Channa striata]
MAQRGVQLDQEKLCCSICLDLLKDPVTIPCGHSYCMNCIKGHWDEEEKGVSHSCPQCRKLFIPRPALVKNGMLADLVEDLKKTGLQAAAHPHCYAGPGDVACDFCIERKLKATKSCLQCLASYCELHLQPHYESQTFQKHKLIEALPKLQENICSRHNKMREIFCRTDQQRICYLCSVDEHKGHDTVLAAAESSETQRELEGSRREIQQRIRDKEKDVKLLQQEVEAISVSADKAVEDSEKLFTEIIRLMEKRRSELKKKIRSQLKTKRRQVKELQKKLEQEITELKRKNAELEQMSLTEDHIDSGPSPSTLSEPTDSSSINIRPLRYFEEVTAAVSELSDQLQDLLRETWTTVSQRVTDVDVLLPLAEPKTRTGFLTYACEITLDQNTVHKNLVLSEGNKRVTCKAKKQLYPHHSDRFKKYFQVFSKESMSRRSYWEVESSFSSISVAVAYKNISRTGSKSEFGYNDKSWALYRHNKTYVFRHNGISTPVSGPQSSRVGIYLDYRAGILSFYSVSETMTLLHRVQTTFTQPLHAGLWVRYCGIECSAELCDPL